MRPLDSRNRFLHIITQIVQQNYEGKKKNVKTDRKLTERLKERRVKGTISKLRITLGLT